MKVGSLFSGVGGLELGLERAGMEVVWQAEYDKQARRVLARHWPDVHRYEDVHDVKFHGNIESDAGKQPGHQTTSDGDHRSAYAGDGYGCREPVDVICGGFPCQDYSLAGKRGGLAGDRGALFWEMHRIVAGYRPTWVVGENVPGLLSSNGGADFRTIIASLVQLGYGVTWATLDSQYFGVAQRRRRLFIVGHSGGVPRPEVLAISEGLFGHPAPSREAGKGATGGAAYSVDRNINPHGPHGPLQAVGKAYGDVVSMASGSSNAEITEGFSPTLTTSHDGPPIAFTAESVHQDGTHQDGTHHPLRVRGRAAVAGVDYFNGAETGDIAATLGANSGSSANHAGPGVIVGVPRRLTPVECERLQGFPDDWTRYGHDGTEMADSPRYRMMGNAVTVNVAEWIGRRILASSELHALP